VKTAPIGMQEWMEYFKQATLEVVATALKFESPAQAAQAAKGAKPAPRGKASAPVKDDGPRPGAYIAIMAEGASVHLGLTATAEGCRALARSLLGLHPTQDLTDQETGDAVSELMNIIAGKVKSRVSERDQTLRLGLPMFIQGRIQETGSMERQAAEVEVGPVTCHLLVYRNKRSG
jgi:hypothetical protein